MPIRTINLNDPDYPSLLKEIYDPPAVLYVRGEIPQGIYLAVVGTRRMSDYGERATRQLVRELSRLGVVIISGLATGIDTVAHETALENKGKTIAVLGSGIDDQAIFPASNVKLAHRIVEQGGAVISEYPPLTRAMRYYFPLRNRIISGLSKGVLVVEAPEKSGALVTAYRALEQNREVFALPGPIYSSRSWGTNHLIQKGAKLVLQVEDILTELGLEIKKVKKTVQLTLEEEIILKSLAEESLHIDELQKRTSLDMAKLSSTLTLLELKGLIRHLGHEKFSHC